MHPEPLRQRSNTAELVAIADSFDKRGVGGWACGRCGYILTGASVGSVNRDVAGYLLAAHLQFCEGDEPT